MPTVNATKEDGLSLHQASKLFNVPKSTIKDHLDDDHSSMGRPIVLSAEEEVQLLEKIQVLADWGFPLTGQDVCHFVKSYLDIKKVSGLAVSKTICRPASELLASLNATLSFA
jgi:hypothetical protein